MLFQGKTIPVTVRFSDSTGLPDIPDGDGNANPHGMSVKFHLPDGSEVDIVENSLKFFPVATGEEFRDLLQAVAESGPAAAKPSKIDAFFASHPAAPRAFASAETPVSFAREAYNGITFPGNLTDGIEVSDDPLIDTRNEAYAVSFSRRSQ